MNSYLPDITRPHEPSPDQKCPYSTPTLRILAAAELNEAARAFNVVDLDPPAEDPDALLGAYRAAVEREALAWQAVGMQLPGEPGFSPKAWQSWQRASFAERQARAKWEAAAANQSDFAQLWLHIR